MSIIEELHAARKARLERMGVARAKPVQMVEAIMQPPRMDELHRNSVLKMRDIIDATCAHFDVNETSLLSKRREVKVSYPRQIIMYLAYKYTPHSFPEIGRRLGGRDHTTVVYGVSRIRDRCLAERDVAYDVAHIEATL